MRCEAVTAADRLPVRVDGVDDSSEDPSPELVPGQLTNSSNGVPTGTPGGRRVGVRLGAAARGAEAEADTGARDGPASAIRARFSGGWTGAVAECGSGSFLLCDVEPCVEGTAK